jgi:hypothetical protein
VSEEEHKFIYKQGKNDCSSYNTHPIYNEREQKSNEKKGAHERSNYR